MRVFRSDIFADLMPGHPSVRALWRAVGLASMALLASACGGSADTPTGITTPPPITPAPVVPGLLSVTVTGLPEGTNADVVVTGAASFSRYVTSTVGWTDVPAGSYTITVRPVRAPNGTFAAAAASQSVSVAAAAASVATVNYKPLPSVLALDVTGVPGGVDAAISLTMPRSGTNATAVGKSGVFTASTQNDATATPDQWQLAAQSITNAGTRYLPSLTSLDTTVKLGDTAHVAVRYTVGSGAIAVAIGGLPNGVNADALLIAPDNSTRPITGTTTVTGLDAGRYRLVTRSLTAGGLAYVPNRDTLTLDVALSLVATPAPVTYIAQAGRLALTVSGVPTGSAGALTLVGPNGSRAITSSVTLDSIPTGAYTLTAASLLVNGERYAPTPASQDINISTGGTITTSVQYALAPTTVEVSVAGLPSGTNSAITLTSPSGDASAITRSTIIAPAAAGRWRLSAASVVTSTAIYDPSPASYDRTVAAGDALALPVQYTIASGSIALLVEGLAASASPTVTITGPNSFSRVVSATTTLTNLAPGTYTITAGALTISGETFAASQPTQTVSVVPSLVAAPATVTYRQTTGTIALTLSGLPTGGFGAISVTGPNGFNRGLTSSATLNGLAAGSYVVSAAAVTLSGSDWNPSPSVQSITVAAATTAPATITYTQALGTLTVNVSGVPSGNANVTVAGPNGFTRNITGTTSFSSLTPGSYTITAQSVAYAGNNFTPGPASQTVTVNATNAATTASVSYSQTTGSLALAVTGLPNGANGSVTITGPGGYSQAFTATTTITGLTPGSYTVNASNVTVAGSPWVPTPTSQTISVTAIATAAGATVRYAQNPGALTVTVTGLPNGTIAAVTVTGPNSFSQAVNSTSTLSGLTAGSYTVAASNVTVSGNVYVPSPTSQSASVSSGATTSSTVTYALSTGSLTVNVSGVPGGSSAAITVTGPSSYTRSVTSTTTITGLTPGSYTIAASTISASGSSYTASPTTQSATVSASLTPASATVTYTLQSGGGGVNYTINNAYLTQAIQKPDGSVALVANRDALLRVFVTASGANTAQPQVRVRIYDGATLLTTNTLSAPESSVRQSVDEGTLTSTWNMLIPAANVRTTLKVLLDLDPSALVADADRNDNSWPANGTPKAITVSNAPTFNVRFVPVVVGALTGNVSAANKDQFLVTTRRIWPVQNIASDVRAPFTSSATDLQSNDGNNQWLTVLSEMNTLRSTDGAPSTMHYYGVVKVNYTSGIAGYGYVPGRAAIGWDYLPSGDGVAAHEWGHNFSRQHAPCGTSGDPSYPYAGAVINYWGWNSTTNALVSPSATDVMSYCSNNWVSDYNWTAVMNYRATSGLQAASLQASDASVKQDGLLVWGRVVNGVIQLEPAFRVSAPITPAATRPTHRLDLVDNAGRALLQLPIEASLVDHTEGRDERQFAVVVPWSATLADRLDQIRVADQRVPLRSVARRGAFASPASARETGPRVAAADLEPGETLAADGPNRVKISWRNNGYGMAMVRDASTGQIMGYVRRQGQAVVTGGRRVDVVFSDGVRSAVKTLR